MRSLEGEGLVGGSVWGNSAKGVGSVRIGLGLAGGEPRLRSLLEQTHVVWGRYTEEAAVAVMKG